MIGFTLALVGAAIFVAIAVAVFGAVGMLAVFIGIGLCVFMFESGK